MNLALWQSQFQEWLEPRHYSARTIQSYTAELRPLLDYLEGCGVMHPNGISRQNLEGYRAFLFNSYHRGKRIAAGTQNYRLSAVKTFVRFLFQERFVAMDLAACLDLPRVPRPLPRNVPTENEVQRLLAVPKVTSPLSLRDRALLELFYGTAVRNSELRALTLDEVDFEKSELQLAGKGRRERVLPLGEEALIWLERYLLRARPRFPNAEQSRLVFLTKQGRPLQRGPLAKLVSRMARRAGVKRTVTPHSLRHACAQHMLERGAGLRHLQELLGHASLDTTQRYTRIALSSLRSVLERCHPRERGDKP